MSDRAAGWLVVLFFLVLGLGTLAQAALFPRLLFKGWSAAETRRLLGATGARAVYAVVGVLFTSVGVALVWTMIE